MTVEKAGMTERGGVSCVVRRECFGGMDSPAFAGAGSVLRRNDGWWMGVGMRDREGGDVGIDRVSGL